MFDKSRGKDQLSGTIMVHQYGLDVGIGAARWIDRENREKRIKKRESDDTSFVAEEKGKIFEFLSYFVFLFYLLTDKKERNCVKAKDH